MRFASGVLCALLAVASLLSSGCFHQRGSTSADEFLPDSPYSSMFIEIDYQQGKAPIASAVDLLKQRINERCHKPGGVTSEQKAFTQSEEIWTLQEIRALEEKERDRRHGGDTAVLYILYLGGRFEADNSQGRVLGVHYGPSSIALFKDNMAFAATPTNAFVPLPFTATDVERAVIVHEFGHALGLVNHGLSMTRDHEDKEHEGHSTNKDSVMYWAVESSILNTAFSGPPPTQFDADDIADLRAAGGK